MHQCSALLEVHLHTNTVRTVADHLGFEQSAPLPRVHIECNRNGERCAVRLYWHLYGKVLVARTGRADGFESFQCEADLWTV